MMLSIGSRVWGSPGGGVQGRRSRVGGRTKGEGLAQWMRGEPLRKEERRKREGERILIVRERVRRYAASTGPMSRLGASGFAESPLPPAFFGGGP